VSPVHRTGLGRHAAAAVPMRRPPTQRQELREATRREAWTAVGRADRTRARGLLGLAALGTVVAAYLTWVHATGGVVLCTGAFGCEQVQASRYSTVGGLPIAGFGLVLYLTLL